MQGETRKIPPAAFVSFGAQKKTIFRFRLLLHSKGKHSYVVRDAPSKFSSFSGTFCQAVHRAQRRFELVFRLAGELDSPLLPFGLSSPVSEKVQSS